MVADVLEVITDAVGLSSFSCSPAAVAVKEAWVYSVAHHAVTQDVVPLSGLYFCFAAVVVAASSKNPAMHHPCRYSHNPSMDLSADGILFFGARPYRRVLFCVYNRNLGSRNFISIVMN